MKLLKKSWYWTCLVLALTMPSYSFADACKECVFSDPGGETSSPSCVTREHWSQTLYSCIMINIQGEQTCLQIYATDCDYNQEGPGE